MEQAAGETGVWLCVVCVAVELCGGDRLRSKEVRLQLISKGLLSVLMIHGRMAGKGSAVGARARVGSDLFGEAI